MKDVRVLVVDDEVHIRLYVKTLLAGMGAKVVAEASNGQEAIARFESERPDLVLLDVNMPVMDGLAALHALRFRSEEVAIVMLTSLAGVELVKDCLEAGADHVLRKDLPPDELRRELGTTWQELRGESGEAP